MATATHRDTGFVVRWEVDDTTGLAAVTVGAHEIGYKAFERDNGVVWTAVAAGSGLSCWVPSDNKVVSALTYGSSVAVDCADGNIFTLTMSDDCTIDAPSNEVVGQVYTFITTQSAATKTLSWNAAYKGLAASLANTEVDTAVDVFHFVCTAADTLYCLGSELNITGAS